MASADLAAADAAAAAGDFEQARALLERAVALPGAGIATWLRLAALRRAGGDPAAALDAVHGALALDPLDFTALLLKANLLDRLEPAGAGEAYDRALAQRPSVTLPKGLVRAVEHAERRAGEERARRAAVLAAAIGAAAPAATVAERARLDRFRTNRLRITRPYRSEPTDYCYPGLAEREFHDRDDFPWLAAFEAETDAIAAEFEAVMAAELAELEPYVRYPADVPVAQWAALNGSRDWTAIHLVNRGRVVEANTRHCPSTMAAIARLPQPTVPGRGPNAMFSLLAPGTHIPSHVGVANTRLVCHLPLVVPPGCWFRVGETRRSWRRGEAFVFDDTIEHEARNDGAALRVVLIVDVWHPGLSVVERAGVAAVMAADAGDVGAL